MCEPEKALKLLHVKMQKEHLVASELTASGRYVATRCMQLAAVYLAKYTASRQRIR
jgi:hypothetical protein